MATERVLQEGVMCRLCADGRSFHHLAGHLTHIHGTNQEEYRQLFGMPPDEPLHSKQYAKSRSRIASRPQDMRRATAILNSSRELRAQTIAALRARNLFTTVQASELTGFIPNTFKKAIKEGRLSAGIACLTAFVPDNQGTYQNVKLPGLPQAIMTKEDLLSFMKTQPKEIQGQTIRRLLAK